MSWAGLARTNNYPSYWFDHGPSQSCLKLITTSKSWTHARQNCQQLGGDLVKIKDSAMNTFLKNKLSSFTQNWWIGLKKHGNSYRWNDESTNAAYTNIETGTIFDSVAVRDCFVHDRNSGKWFKSSCSATRPSVCQNHYSGYSSCWFNQSTSVSYLKLITASKSWTNARQNCQQLGGDLVKIEDSGMNTFLKNKLSSFTQNWWIGLKKSGNSYRWLNESTNAAYTNIETGTIFDSVAVRDCFVYDRNSGQWFESSCDATRPSLCQSPLT
ncbi:hypothetical protein RRG08_059303 [Elysia crispata]|uniref:C-type lectin domain-containing protein n=1 Tax=Elysia crispata TaxID=231223 RepID=A0AAE1DE20_9GAST|nr:hypothetical protein RRG08_059303 [Elysia crispata]